VLVVGLTGQGEARQLTLDQALKRALNQTARGEMIRGNLEVAQQYYRARRINMYLPEISINGSVPTYAVDESYRPYSDPHTKELFENRNLDFRSFIELKQSLFTGGNLTATANLRTEDNRYPDTRYDAGSGLFVNENSKIGFFNFSLAQPLFRPSAVKYELNNRKDDLEIARVTRIEEESGFRKEVTQAYVGLLQLTLRSEMTGDELEKTLLQEQIDSAKLTDGVISEEDFLMSSSARLDAELAHFEIKTQREEQKRELYTLLDLDITETLKLVEPIVGEHLDSAEAQRLVAAWEHSAPIKKAERVYAKAERQADYAASGHGLTGDLNVGYNMGQQKIEEERTDSYRENDINTRGWSVSLDFRMPIWDGGAGSAAVKAARFQAEQANYEYTRARRSAKAQIANYVNQLDVCYSRLDIIRQQIDLSKERLDIAEERHADGQISMLTLLDARVFYLENKNRYLEELKTYLTNRIDLESKFVI